MFDTTPHTPLLPQVRAFLDQSPHTMLIDGSWQAASDGSLIAVNDPATGQHLSEIADGTAEDVDHAVSAARNALRSPAWSAMNPSERSKILWKIADLLEEHIDELAQLETLDQGKPLAVGRFGEMLGAINQFRYYAGFPTKITGSTIPVSIAAPPQGRQAFAYTLREPVGVVAAIVPWNSPLLMAAMKLAPALAAGCTVVLKPAEETSLTAIMFGQLLAESGLPAGVVNIVTGYGHTVGAALSAHPGVNKVAFTGSTAVGKQLLTAAQGNLKRLTLELGGKSPAIVLPDADIDLAVAGLSRGIFNNSGQVCVANSRVYVHEKVYDTVVEALANRAERLTLGHGLNPATDLGPLVNPKQAERVNAYVTEGMSDGARVAAGGNRVAEDSNFFEPTVLTDVRQDMTIMQEEIFGPVVAVTPFSELDQVIEWANDSVYGLAASVWSESLSDTNTLIRELDSGTVWVNCHSVFGPDLPKGGHKQSGWGYENGHEGLENYLESKTVCMFT